MLPAGGHSTGHTHTHVQLAAPAVNGTAFTPHSTMAKLAMTTTHRYASPDPGGSDRGDFRSIRTVHRSPGASYNSSRVTQKTKPKMELLPWDNTAGGRARLQRGITRQGTKNHLQGESLQELKAGFMARLQQVLSMHFPPAY